MDGLHIFPATYQGHSQPRSKQSHLLKFEVEDANAELLKEMLPFSLDKPVVVVVYEVVEGVDPLKNAATNKEEMRKTFLARIHATIKKYSEITELDVKEIKKILKARMKMYYPDKDSLAQYEEGELMNCLRILQTELNPAGPRSYDYKKHLT